MGRPLRVVHAMGLAGYAAEAGVSRLSLAEVAHTGQALVDETLARVHREAPGVSAAGVVRVEEGATQALLTEGVDAEMMVLGSRGRGGFGELLLGSTAHAVARHAPCPLVVVRGAGAPEPADAPVVVGVDGSAVSRDAVAFAFAAASVRGVGLTAVHAWTRPLLGPPDLSDYGVSDAGEAERLGQTHAAVLSESLAGYREQHPDVPVTEQVVEGHPGKVLVEVARGAGLLVVGSRGLGGFRGLVLGSISSAVLHHGGVPVAVVRGASTDDPG